MTVRELDFALHFFVDAAGAECLTCGARKKRNAQKPN